MRFEEFVESQGDALVRFAYLLTGDPQLAQDLVQTALLRAFRRWPRIENPSAYLRRAVVNANTDRIRRPRLEILTSPEHLHAVVGSEALDETDPFPLWEHIRRLPTRQRAVLVLRYYDGLDDKQIATTLGIRSSSVRSAAARALESLRRAVPRFDDHHRS